MDVVRPALQRRMHGTDAPSAGHIQYNLLAIVDDPYLRVSDELEMLKRERAALERRLAELHPEGWEDKVCFPLSVSRSRYSCSRVLFYVLLCGPNSY